MIEEIKIKLEGAKTHSAESLSKGKTGQGRGKEGGSINQMNIGKSQPFISETDQFMTYLQSRDIQKNV